jgi:hypothetical protein
VQLPTSGFSSPAVNSPAQDNPIENIVAVVPQGGYIQAPEAKPDSSGTHLGKTGSFRLRTDIAT